MVSLLDIRKTLQRPTRLSEDKALYCEHPFTRLEIKADGRAFCCCEGWLPTPLGNVLESNLVNLWRNSAIAAQIRESIVDQSFRYCTACPYLPGTGGPVSFNWPSELPNADRIGLLKLDYDQSCQLACPSCRTHHSRHWVNHDKVKEIHDAVLASGVLDLVDQLYVTGAGDPFASKLYWEFLQNLPDLSRNPKMTIFLHTNGLLLDQDHWEAMPEARKRVTDIGISIDAATPETYKYIRGGSWSKLWDNIAFLNHLRARRNIVRPIVLGMFYTVQAANFRELVPFVKMAIAGRANWINVTAMRNWGTFTGADYESRAVHQPYHPQHAEWLRVLEDPILKDPRVILERFDPKNVGQGVLPEKETLHTLRRATP